MKKLAFCFAFLAFGQIAYSQDPLLTKVLTPDEMKEDFSLYRNMLEDTHPGIYRYASKQEIQNSFDSILLTLAQPKSYYAFYADVLSMAAKIRCSHTYLFPSQDAQRYSMQQIRTLPFYTVWASNKLFILFNGSMNEEIRPGFEILRINGKTVEEIKETIYRFAWSDGAIESAKGRFLSGQLFWIAYYTLVDQSASFELECADLAGQVKTFKVDARAPGRSMANRRKNPANKEILKVFKQKKSKPFELSFPKEIENTALLQISEFGGKGIDDEEQAKLFTSKFMDKALAKMKKKGTESLIIDLRYNQGGWDVIGMELLSYLVKSSEPFRYFKKGIATLKDTAYLKYTDYTYADWQDAQKELDEQSDGTFLLNEYNNVTLQQQHPKANRFEGDLYFLINESTGSAASEFAAMAKSYELGPMVGMETNGAYEGGNGSTFIRMKLPNSRIFVNSPLVAGYLNNDPQEIPNRGVIPDYMVDFSREEMLTRFDVQMEKVKELIRRKL